MSRRPKESQRRATLTRNGIVASDLLAAEAKPPTHAREVEGEPPAVESTERGNQAPSEEALARALVTAQRMGDQIIEDSKVKAKMMLAEAEARAKRMIEQAQIRAQEITRERIQSAEARARVAEEQARMQIHQATEQVARRRQELESSIEALRAFENDYRARLRGFVEAQAQAMDQEVKAINQEVKAIDRQAKAIESSKDAPPSPELLAASLEALKTFILNYETLVKSFARGQLNTLDHVVPAGSLAPQQPSPPQAANDDTSPT